MVTGASNSGSKPCRTNTRPAFRLTKIETGPVRGGSLTRAKAARSALTISCTAGASVAVPGGTTSAAWPASPVALVSAGVSTGLRAPIALAASEFSVGAACLAGFHGLAEVTKRDLAARGVDLLEDLICPFIAKLDRVVERLAAQGYDIAIVGRNGNHHCETAREIAALHGRRCFVIEQAGDAE